MKELKNIGQNLDLNGKTIRQARLIDCNFGESAAQKAQAAAAMGVAATGSLSDLNTKKKDNLVEAINEANGSAVFYFPTHGLYGWPSTLSTSAALKSQFDELFKQGTSGNGPARYTAIYHDYKLYPISFYGSSGGVQTMEYQKDGKICRVKKTWSGSSYSFSYEEEEIGVLKAKAGRTWDNDQALLIKLATMAQDGTWGGKVILSGSEQTGFVSFAPAYISFGNDSFVVGYLDGNGATKVTYNSFDYHAISQYEGLSAVQLAADAALGSVQTVLPVLTTDSGYLSAYGAHIGIDGGGKIVPTLDGNGQMVSILDSEIDNEGGINISQADALKLIGLTVTTTTEEQG